ncbi:MAG TPA: asparagine synthase-related protein, partial [Gaiellales bacterium]|nr:asparagine synthase-related protein [Gaiellales bacterium]
MRVIGGLLSRDPRVAICVHDLAAMTAGTSLERVRSATSGPIGMLAVDGQHQLRSERAWLVADLDLTNLSELRAQVGGDTAVDVVLSLYERDGLGFVRELHGAFALALWDRPQRRLVLAVDRFGIGRLYHTTTPTHVAFASRADGLRAVAGVDASVDPVSDFLYLNFGYVPGPASIYRGMHRLPAGHLLTVAGGEARTERYWDLQYTERSIGVMAAATEVYRHTEAAVTRAISAAPAKETGAFLSGGTDSSTIVGLMSRLSGEKVSAFSIGFSEERYDELAYAELTARHFGATHYTQVITPGDAFELLPGLIEAYDEPFGNDSAIGALICARLAAECGVTRLIAGDGGDEIFGGNERYRTDAIFGLYHRLPRLLRHWVIEPTLAAAPEAAGSLVDRARRYVRRANIPNPHRFYSYEFHFWQHAEHFLRPEFVA